MNQISHTPESLFRQAYNRYHQYRGGLVLFLGTIFVPTEDCHEIGLGFTHKVGDHLEISSPKLGKFMNWVNYCHKIPKWMYDRTDLMQYCYKKAYRQIATKQLINI